MTVVATLALVAVVALALVGLDRRDAVVFGVALLLEDVIMLGNAVVLVVLLVAVGIVWWRGRMERERVARVAREAEARRRAQADAAAVDAIAAAQARADRDRSRPAADVLTDAMRRGGR